MAYGEDDRSYSVQAEEEEDEMMSCKLNLTHPSSSSSSAKYTNFFPQASHGAWPSISAHSQQEHRNDQQSVNVDKNLEITDLSLGNNNEDASTIIEKEHMFDKVVTPSDVGKLNRLVIPKQHAEKYFPLDSSSNEKGLVLNFEDRNGKPWRFRYSYWNSSQSYVMTKGWSRFVKEKKLEAGDIVSFQRGLEELNKHRLYIDWRRRSNPQDLSAYGRIDLRNRINMQQSIRWGRLCTLPPTLFHQQHEHLRHPDYGVSYPSYHPHYHQQATHGYGNAAAPVYLRPAGGYQQAGNRTVPMVIDSVPVVHGKTGGKRLRLFGVNMECSMHEDSASVNALKHGIIDSNSSSHFASSSVNSQPPTRTSTGTFIRETTSRHDFSKKGKSLSFDLDL